MPKTRETGLRAVLFTDVVSSTELAREMGDVRWSRLLEAQRRVIRRLLRSMGGREVDTAGDGFFAVFDRTADAVRCAFAACREVQELGLDIRAGVHVGEVELAGHEVHGIVVHTGARVMGQAGASEVLVTATVKDLVAGARFDLRERGTVELKGVPGTWTLYDVMAVDEQLRPAPIEQASVASERRDRVASSPLGGGRGRRWILPVAAAAVVIAVVAAYELTRTEPTSVPAPGTVARIDDAGTVRRAGAARLGAHRDRVGRGEALGHGSARPGLLARPRERRERVTWRCRRSHRRRRRRRRGVGHERFRRGRRPRRRREPDRPRGGVARAGLRNADGLGGDRVGSGPRLGDRHGDR